MLVEFSIIFERNLSTEELLNAMWKILIVAVFLLQTSLLMGDQEASQSQQTEESTGAQVIVITDPDIAAADDEEPDCE